MTNWKWIIGMAFPSESVIKDIQFEINRIKVNNRRFWIFHEIS